MLTLLGILVAVGAIFLLKPESSPSDVIGHIKQDLEVRNNDVARGMALDLWKFEFTLNPGKYYIDTWLEVWDKATSSTSRLSPGKSFVDTEIIGGSVVISILDPATTPEEKGKTWRYVIDRDIVPVQGGASLGSQVNTIANPLPSSEASGWHDTKEADIRLGEEITLITWSAGDEVLLGNHKVMQENARSVMFKMKVVPASEAFK